MTGIWQKRVLETRLTPTLKIWIYTMNLIVRYSIVLRAQRKWRLTGIVREAVHVFWRQRG